MLRRMEMGDLAEVMEVDALSMPVPWGAAVWRGEITSPFGLCLVVEEEGRILGFIGTKRTLEEVHITTVAVRSEARRRGLARALLNGVLVHYPGVRRVHLEVRPSNSGARAFYDSLGFRETGRRPGYYRDEDALLLTLEL